MPGPSAVRGSGGENEFVGLGFVLARWLRNIRKSNPDFSRSVKEALKGFEEEATQIQLRMLEGGPDGLARLQAIRRKLEAMQSGLSTPPPASRTPVSENPLWQGAVIKQHSRKNFLQTWNGTTVGSQITGKANQDRALNVSGTWCSAVGVLDGHGGDEAAQFLSAQLVPAIDRQIEADGSGALAVCVEKAIHELSESFRASQAASGTTLSALVSTSTETVLVQVGDSRAYRVGAYGSVEQISVDEGIGNRDLAEQLGTGAINPENGYGGFFNLSTFGDFNNTDASSKLKRTPTCTPVTLRPSDKIVFVTDGVYDGPLTEQEFAELIAHDAETVIEKVDAGMRAAFEAGEIATADGRARLEELGRKIKSHNRTAADLAALDPEELTQAAAGVSTVEELQSKRELLWEIQFAFAEQQRLAAEIRRLVGTYRSAAEDRSDYQKVKKASGELGRKIDDARRSFLGSEFAGWEEERKAIGAAVNRRRAYIKPDDATVLMFSLPSAAAVTPSAPPAADLPVERRTRS